MSKTFCYAPLYDVRTRECRLSEICDEAMGARMWAREKKTALLKFGSKAEGWEKQSDW